MPDRNGPTTRVLLLFGLKLPCYYSTKVHGSGPLTDCSSVCAVAQINLTKTRIPTSAYFFLEKSAHTSLSGTALHVVLPNWFRNRIWPSCRCRVEGRVATNNDSRCNNPKKSSVSSFASSSTVCGYYSTMAVLYELHRFVFLLLLLLHPHRVHPQECTSDGTCDTHERW
jgi:hypothetical protein